MPDGDADGVCDPVDLCPHIADPAQADGDGDGIGDACQCTAPAPGRCIAGGGSERTDCLLEFAGTGPATLNRRGTRLKPLFQCSDGEPTCDLDGARDGQCTFGVALCFANADPRYPRCAPAAIRGVEVLQPKASHASAQAIERVLATLGLEVRRRGRVVAEATASMGNSQCSAPVKLVVAAGQKPNRQKLKLRAQATNLRRDTDRLTLLCQ
jgi:hypothetical protein